eukprot:TRINITY_DN1614_c0_g1_i2.p1 TRINITY_DN1614_c0_g1~~TRINITY_DN1614_c0_g1_i2.p1  ORF type:complete len:184 (+),score=30.81 TRINITY_DN1614_c0_g1_i2:723-1274(+)
MIQVGDTTRLSDIVPSELWTVIILYLDFIITAIYVWYLARKNSKITIRTYRDLPSLLETEPSFRVQFIEFLMLQFCVENLLFYESVQSFKKIPNNSLEQTESAMKIFSEYIKEGGIQQINVSSEVRNNIINHINTHTVNSDIFKFAQRQVLELLTFHSLPMFSQYHRERNEKSYSFEIDFSSQ